MFPLAYEIASEDHHTHMSHKSQQKIHEIESFLKDLMRNISKENKVLHFFHHYIIKRKDKPFCLASCHLYKCLYIYKVKYVDVGLMLDWITSIIFSIYILKQMLLELISTTLLDTVCWKLQCTIFHSIL